MFVLLIKTIIIMVGSWQFIIIYIVKKLMKKQMIYYNFINLFNYIITKRMKYSIIC